MKLIKLRDEDINEFKKLMISAFQYGYESFCGKCKEQILPEKDIDDDLNKKDTFAYEMIDNNEIVGGAIVSINEETNHNYLDFLFVKVGVQGKGIGKKYGMKLKNSIQIRQYGRLVLLILIKEIFIFM